MPFAKYATGPPAMRTASGQYAQGGLAGYEYEEYTKPVYAGGPAGQGFQRGGATGGSSPEAAYKHYNPSKDLGVARGGATPQQTQAQPQSATQAQQAQGQSGQGAFYSRYGGNGAQVGQQQSGAGPQGHLYPGQQQNEQFFYPGQQRYWQ